MPRFHIHTLGCKVNQAESDSIAARLEANGWERVCPEDAELAILNTCTVTGEADAKNRKSIRRLLQACTGPVLVTGCSVNISSDFYRSLSPRVFCEGDKAKIAMCAGQLLAADVDIATRGLRAGEGYRTRINVKVQDGCDNACSYCIVRTARGAAVSVPVREVVREVELLEARAAELVLVGIDLAAYESDGLDLAGLLVKLQADTQVGRIRVSSVEPQSVDAGLARVLAASDGRVCRHLHLCLQSGSSKVLREMNRRYSSDQFVELVHEMRRACPGLALSTDVIVGFPGETDADFEQTLRVVEECAFMRLHVFRYSKRPGTPAAAREDQVDPRVAAARSKRLQELGRRLASRDRELRVGTRELVVVERNGWGTGESYHSVALPNDLEPGTLAEVEFTANDDARGCLVARALQCPPSRGALKPLLVPPERESCHQNVSPVPVLPLAGGAVARMGD